jgi:hypothetical protein
MQSGLPSTTKIEMKKVKQVMMTTSLKQSANDEVK